MKTVVILQSNYIPWKGYFDLLHEADEFVIYDDRQYTRQDWRNRNQVKTQAGVKWISIPVVGKFGQRIDETAIADREWAARHWQYLTQLYRQAPYFKLYAESVEALYLAAADIPLLSVVNRLFLEGVGRLLGLSVRLRSSAEFRLMEGRTERLVELCRATGATRYVSGPAARSYLQQDLFAQAGIDVVFKSYEGYPEYPQLFPPFTHGVTALDLLFNVGPDAPWYIWGWRYGPLREKLAQPL